MWAAVAISVSSILLGADASAASLAVSGVVIASAFAGTVFIVRRGALPRSEIAPPKSPDTRVVTGG
jgi:hypothetical protein